jgi:PilZ domain
MQERRQAERFRTNLQSRWESLLAHGRGEVVDLSATGCFMLAAAQLKADDLVRLQIQFPDHLLFLWGQVVYQIPEMGFAVRFVFSEENEALELRNLIEKINQTAV